MEDPLGDLASQCATPVAFVLCREQASPEALLPQGSTGAGARIA